jgi:hypothetical protein
MPTRASGRIVGHSENGRDGAGHAFAIPIAKSPSHRDKAGRAPTVSIDRPTPRKPSIRAPSAHRASPSARWRSRDGLRAAGRAGGFRMRRMHATRGSALSSPASHPAAAGAPADFGQPDGIARRDTPGSAPYRPTCADHGHRAFRAPTRKYRPRNRATGVQAHRRPAPSVPCASPSARGRSQRRTTGCGRRDGRREARYATQPRQPEVIGRRNRAAGVQAVRRHPGEVGARRHGYGRLPRIPIRAPAVAATDYGRRVPDGPPGSGCARSALRAARRRSSPASRPAAAGAPIRRCARANGLKTPAR